MFELIMDQNLLVKHVKIYLYDTFCIHHQNTCVYTPQQNGVMEHKHRHLLQVACAILFQYCLPKCIWGDAILTTTYIINYLPTSLLIWQSPYKALFQRLPNYQFLKSFGSLYFASNINQYKGKFETRAFKSILIGY